MLFTDTSPFIVPTSDGLVLAGNRCGPLFAAATVVYVHGLLCDGSWWRPLTEQVHDRLDGQVAQIVWDQRGHGRSGRPHRSVETTLDHLADDLDAVLTRATGSVVLVTHSAGSMIAAAYAQRYPARAAALAGLVLFNPPANSRNFLLCPSISPPPRRGSRACAAGGSTTSRPRPHRWPNDDSAAPRAGSVPRRRWRPAHVPEIRAC